MNEDAEQIAVAINLDAARLDWCHVPNGGKRSKAEAAKFRRMGVKPGVPDILVFSTTPEAPLGAAIELKRRDGGRASVPQKKWLARLEEIGWRTRVCHGAQAAIEFLRELGYEI